MKEGEKKSKPEFIELLSVKRNNKNGLDVKWKVQRDCDGVTMEEVDSRESPVVPDPVIGKIFDELNEMLASACNLLLFERVRNATNNVTAKQKEAFKNLKKPLDNLRLEILDKVECTSISFSGQENNVGVIISGKMTGDNGAAFALNTPRIRLSDDKFGIEDDLNSAINQLRVEVYEYIYNGKRAQLEIDFNGGEKEAA